MTGTEDWVEEAYSEVDQMNVQALKSNDEIAKIIASSEQSTTVVEINGVNIKIKSFISRRIRSKLMKAQKVANDNADLEVVETALYETISSLCVDPPYNQPITWRYIDREGGDVNSALTKIMMAVTEVSRQTKDFRPKS